MVKLPRAVPRRHLIADRMRASETRPGSGVRHQKMQEPDQEEREELRRGGVAQPKGEQRRRGQRKKRKKNQIDQLMIRIKWKGR